jgi:hypothetical protein
MLHEAMTIWTVTERDIFTLRGAGGELFTKFCDSLLRIECIGAGIPLTQLATNQRTVRPDGGVDTRLSGVCSDILGALKTNTIWQYKATDASNIDNSDLKVEVNKPYAAELLREGYAYRLAICDDIPDKTRRDWEQTLAQEIHAINPAAPVPLVITAGQLAAWASQFPAMRVAFVGAPLASVLHMETWGRNVTDKVQQYVPLAGRAGTTEALTAHVDMSRTPARVDHLVEGHPGIGKTRLVYETLQAAHVGSLVLYTNDDRIAIEAAASLANANCTAVLVVDDCPLPARLRIAEVLAGTRERVRVVTIQSPEQRQQFRADETWLSKMSDDDIDRILDVNFEEVPQDHRREYRDISKGYIRAAVELCRNDTLIVTHGRHAALADLAEYVQVRLNADQRVALEAVSLFHRIGFKDDVADEFRSAATLLRIDADAVAGTIAQMKDTPGFIAEAGRYYYVTPTVVADVAFHLAWGRWARADPRGFLSGVAALPSAAVESFLRRVSISANQEVGRAVGDFFRQLIVGTQPNALADGRTSHLLCTLVEADAENNLSLLLAIVQRASPAELRFHGTAEGGWSGRRHLVWLAERLARFPEHFRQAETLLWELARHESEPGIGNNATAQWQQLFRLYLSGTAIPFGERFTILRDRFMNAQGDDLLLVVGAVGQIFNEYPVRMGGSVYLAGRLAPDDWQPRTYGEIYDAQRAAIQLLGERVSAVDSRSQETITKVIIEHAWTILDSGLLNELAAFVAGAALSSEQMLGLVSSVREFVERNADSDDEGMQKFVKSIRAWVSDLTGASAYGQLLALLSAERYIEADEREEQWQIDAIAVAQRIVNDSAISRESLELVGHANPYRAFVLGKALGARDATQHLLATIIENAINTGATAFAAGYTAGSAATSQPNLAAVNAAIDRLEGQAPAVAFELSKAVGADAHHMERALKQVRARRLSVRYLKSLMFGVAGQRLRRDELSSILDLLLSETDDRKDATTVALELLSYYIREAPLDGPALDDEYLRRTAWSLVERLDDVREDYVWSDVMKRLAPHDYDRAIRIAVDALARGSFGLRRYAEPVIAEISKQRPGPVLNLLLNVLASDELPVGLLVGTVRHLVATFPLDVIRPALRKATPIAVRRFARHLAPPTIINGEPVVPELTLFVLIEFEEDDEVFNSFYSGTHSLRMYSGDIAAHHDREADVAAHFLNHPARRIREWATIERDFARRQAKRWRDQHAEEASER